VFSCLTRKDHKRLTDRTPWLVYSNGVLLGSISVRYLRRSGGVEGRAVVVETADSVPMYMLRKKATGHPSG
jgi:hypothetical protein